MKTDETYTEYIFNFVDTICKKFGPRFSCSNAEKDANQWIKNELAKFCDTTFVDEFETRPGLYTQGIFKIIGVLCAIAFIFMPLIWPLPIFSSMIILIGLFILFNELFYMREWIRPFFKVGISSNVFGIIKPTGNVKFRIIFEGHTDSAKQMGIAGYEKKPPMYRFILGIYYLAHTILFSLIKFFAQLGDNNSIVLAKWWIFLLTMYDWFYFIPFLIIYPCFIWLVFRGLLGKEVVLGANDNLVASGISAAIGKYLNQNKPKNVEVWVGSQGSEEIGDKGAKYFVEKYGELGKLDKSYAVVLDSCGAGTKIFLIHKDTMHRATYSMEIIERLKKAHELYKTENPNVINCEIGRIPLGSCDACRYVHKGYKAAGLIVVDAALRKPRNWHSIHDTPENLDKNVLKDILEICLNFVEIVDKEFE